jgi:putative chitinase
MITAQLLAKYASQGKDIATHAAALEAARATSTVTTTARLCCFLGQIYVETGGFARMVENLNYKTASRLDAIFSAVKGEQDAKDLIAKGPMAIANRVYANRLGNGNEASGDGWRYRGSGYKQLTGRSNYRDIGRLVGMPLEQHPEMAREPVSAAKVAFAFWDARNCSPLADKLNISEITRLVNGPARLGLAERRAATIRAQSIWK